jgi:hypothetical protein
VLATVKGDHLRGHRRSVKDETNRGCKLFRVGTGEAVSTYFRLEGLDALMDTWQHRIGYDGVFRRQLSRSIGPLRCG